MTTKKGRVIDLDTANDSMIVDTADLMASYGRSRDTIRRHIRDGVLPPPLDRVGGRYRWTVGLIREWQRVRSRKLIESFSSQPKSAKLFRRQRGSSEFG